MCCVLAGHIKSSGRQNAGHSLPDAALKRTFIAIRNNKKNGRERNTN